MTTPERIEEIRRELAVPPYCNRRWVPTEWLRDTLAHIDHLTARDRAVAKKVLEALADRRRLYDAQDLYDLANLPWPPERAS